MIKPRGAEEKASPHENPQYEVHILNTIPQVEMVKLRVRNKTDAQTTTEEAWQGHLPPGSEQYNEHLPATPKPKGRR